MHEPIRWGLLGAGAISRKFAEAIQVAGGGRVQAVAARDAARAGEFAAAFRACRAFDQYAALVEDPEVDIVYVGTCHPFHDEQARLALEAGKPVLVEKPAVTHPEQLEALLALAKEKGLFFMEGLWTRCFPVMQWVREQVEAGAIGELRLIQANFCCQAPFDPNSRLFNPDLGGGALLDLGIYPLALILDLLREQNPRLVSASARMGSTGVDEQIVLGLESDGGVNATGTASFVAQGDCSARIYGSEGCIEIAEPFWRPESATLRTADGQVQLHSASDGGHGLKYEVAHVQDCLGKGLVESPLMPHADSQWLQAVMWQARQDIGLRYPFDP